jgi:biopolymer transport protein TolR
VRLSEKKLLSEINVTSLVDVTLVLLIIFMITSPLMQLGIEVNLPRAESKPIERTENITITIRKDGTLSIGGEIVPLAALGRTLETAKAKGTKGVLIRADQQVPYGAVVKVLDAARKQGIVEVGLVTELEEEAGRR